MQTSRCQMPLTFFFKAGGRGYAKFQVSVLLFLLDSKFRNFELHILWHRKPCPFRSRCSTNVFLRVPHGTPSLRSRYSHRIKLSRFGECRLLDVLYTTSRKIFKTVVCAILNPILRTSKSMRLMKQDFDGSRGST